MIPENKKQKALATIKRNEYTEISFNLKTKIFKNKKRYKRKAKHNKSNFDN